MIYPKFLEKGNKIGITAVSDGIKDEEKIKRLENAEKKLEEKGFLAVETKNVRTSNLGRSSSIEERKSQLESLYKDKSVDMIVCASGGDFLLEILPYLDFNVIKENIKWIQGYSDPTALLYSITTNLDIATIYSYNIKTFGMKNWHSSLENNVKLWKGEKLYLESLDKYEKDKAEDKEYDSGFNLDSTVKWKSFDKSVCASGRIIGGCIDTLELIIGTKYDGAKKFIDKYKEDGIIWYFDNYDFSSEKIILTMIKYKEMGYFENAKTIIFGRSLVDKSEYGISFEDAIFTTFKNLNIPVIYDVDIGHVAPSIPIINGALTTVKCENGKGSIEFKLK